MISFFNGITMSYSYLLPRKFHCKHRIGTITIIRNNPQIFIFINKSQYDD